MEYAFTAKLLGKYSVQYFYSPESGLLKTESPYWLEEAYSSAIPDLDVGILSRNESNASIVPLILEVLSLSDANLVDIACGYGILTRMLRDRGFNCYGFDQYCQNLFAKYFSPPSMMEVGGLMAFEVLEHVHDPVTFLEEAFQRFNCRNLIFSTLTFANSIPPLDWWYYSFETGQHIAFYQFQTLSMLAKKLGCFYLSLNAGTHLYTEKPLSSLQKKLLTSPRLWRLYGFWYRRLKQAKKVSKIFEDVSYIKEKLALPDITATD
jgi:2-polyprenyl-3-methyl-5-hydroxy-6-metoxy-1,4-benzoquinol methylase